MILQEVSSSVIKNTYKVFTKLLFNNDASKGEQVMTRNGEPVLVMGGAQQSVNQFCERALADALFRNGTTESADRRFEPGAARIAISECKWNPLLEQNPDLDATKMGRFKIILAYITKHCNNRDIISNDLNGKTYQELYDAFGEEIRKIRDTENAELNKLNFKKKDHEYKIVRIDSFEEAKKYHDYTNPESRWCLTYSRENYNHYTNNDKFAMYFCIRDDIDTVEYKIGENCPLDDYGKSLLCIIVDSDGNLATFTTRWNHTDANGNAVAADENVGDKRTISEIVGVNFNEVFKPYTFEELEKIKNIDLSKLTYEKLEENDDVITVPLNRALKDIYDSLINEYDSHDEDEKPFKDPRDLSWEQIVDQTYANYNELFGNCTNIINLDDLVFYEDAVLVTTATGLKKLIGLENRHPSSCMPWVDEIKQIKNNLGYALFAIKNHNENYYTIMVASTRSNLSLTATKTDFDDKIIAFMQSFTVFDTTIVKLSDGSLARIKINEDYSITTLETFELPENYTREENSISYIIGDVDNAVYGVLNNDTLRHNLMSVKNGFNLALDAKYEFNNCNKYDFNYNKDTDLASIALMTEIGYYGRDNVAVNLIKLDTLEPIFEENLPSNDLLRTEYKNVYIRVLNDTRTEEEKRDYRLLFKADIQVINGSKISSKIPTIYTSLGLIHTSFRHPSHPSSIAFTTKNHSNLVLFDINGNILYEAEEEDERLKNMDLDYLQYLIAYYDVDNKCYIVNSHYTNPKFEIRIPQSEIYESFLLKYAAYLLD